MQVCPKCGALLNGTETKCPICNGIFIKEVIETLEEPKKETSIQPISKKEIKSVKRILPFLCLLLIAISYTLFVHNASLQTKKDTPDLPKIEENSEETKPITIHDTIESNEEELHLKEDFTFTWLKEQPIQGTYTLENKEAALLDMYTTKEQVDFLFSSQLDIENIYSIKLFFEDKEWWILGIIKDENTILMANKTTKEEYIFTKK